MKKIINVEWLDNHSEKKYLLFTFEFAKRLRPSMYGYKRRTEILRDAVMELEVFANYSYWFSDGVMTFDKEVLDHFGQQDGKKVIELNSKAGWIDVLEEDSQICTIKLNKEKVEKDLQLPGYFQNLYEEMDRQGFKRE